MQPPGQEPPPERHASKKKSKKASPRADRPRQVSATRAPRTEPIVPQSVEVEPITDTPAGSQYSGTVARILGEVARTQH